MEKRITIVSVVRDEEMYVRCVRSNPYLHDCWLNAIDNGHINEAIPVRYNQFLDAYDYSNPGWIVFCHEDFEFKQPPFEVLANLPIDSLYGPVGTTTELRPSHFPGGHWVGHIHGKFEASHKDGSEWSSIELEVLPCGTPVDVFDCMCLIMHSSLVQKYHLRFDPTLTFDLYVEDFCLAAKRDHGIVSRFLPFACRHWSVGTISPRFFNLRRYLARKYPRQEAFCTVGYALGGGRTLGRRMQLVTLNVMYRWVPWLPKLIAKLVK